MAVNESGNLNSNLAAGMSDSKYKKVVNDRGNAESTTYDSRRDLNDTWYGIHEANHKVLGDGTSGHGDAGFVSTPMAHLP